MNLSPYESFTNEELVKLCRRQEDMLNAYGEAIFDMGVRLMELSQKAYKDPLTGTLNRCGLEQYIADTKPAAGTIVVAADLSHLRLVNNRFGHNAGDKYLLDAAEVLKRCTRTEDAVARTGGDEFVIIMSSEYRDNQNRPLTYQDRLEAVSKRIEREMHIALIDPDNSNLRKCRASIAIGSAILGSNERFDDCLKRADRNMYRHKEMQHIGDFLHPDYDFEAMVDLLKRIGRPILVHALRLPRVPSGV